MKRHRHRWRYLGGRYGGGSECSNCKLLRITSAAAHGGFDYYETTHDGTRARVAEGAHEAPRACSGY